MNKRQVSRRRFLRAFGGIAGSAFLLSNLPLNSSSGAINAYGQSQDPLICDGAIGADVERADAAYHVRETAAHIGRENAIPQHLCNSDERLYQFGEVSFAKSLPHNELGEPYPNAYYSLLKALQTGSPEDFAQVPIEGDLRLTNPQACLAFDLEGPDSHGLSIRSAPSFDHPETSGEMVELYWKALLRDVHFDEYDTNEMALAAAAELSELQNFNGPNEGSSFNERHITHRTLFRGNTPGDLIGPYISQFLLQPVPHGAIHMQQHIRTTVPNDDFMTDYGEWLGVQQGTVTRQNTYDATYRHIRNGRDLGEYVHQDFPFQAYLNASLIMMGMGLPFDEGNPYVQSLNQEGFVTFGVSHLYYLVSSVANRALKAAWFQKWKVNRRLRPEAMGGRIHNTVTGRKAYLLFNEVLRSQALQESFKKHGSYLLPQAYPEGSPTHPSYPAGHATMAGACVTMLKAFFDENAVIPNPVRVSNDGLQLLEYTGRDLTVGGELNKLAANISLGRDFAGVHYRSDGIEGMNLGEQLALRVLEELRLTYNEEFAGFSLTKFNGERVTI